MGNIISILEEARDRIGEVKQGPGIGFCLMCEIFIDDPDQFTCGHPECNKEAREILEEKTEIDEELYALLSDLGVVSIEEAREKIKEITDSAEENKENLKKLFDDLGIASIEGAEGKIEELMSLVNEIEKKLK